jgi:predicted CoA-binding protein
MRALNFKGEIFPVGRSGGEVDGRPIYRTVDEIPGEIDLGVFLVPAKLVAENLDACGRKGAKWGVILSSGFGEYEAEREDLEQELLAVARKHGLRFVGPNCLGIVNFATGLATMVEAAAVELPAREVTVYRIELIRYQPPLLEFRTTVSAGTYIRALARDLGQRLGTAAHCAELRRERVGPFLVNEATDPAGLGPGTPLLSPLRLVEGLQQVALGPGQAEQIGRGRTIPAESGRGGEAALVWQDRLVAVAERIGEQWQPRIVLEPA